MSNPVPGRANRNAAVTGVLIRYFGWRMAFIIPGIVCIMCGLVFAACATRDASAPAKPQASADGHHAGISVAKVLLIMTVAAASGGMLFNFSTSSNYALLSDKFSQISLDPARIGALLALVYALASLTQLLVGNLLDRISLKPLYLAQIAFMAATACVTLAVVSMLPRRHPRPAADG